MVLCLAFALSQFCQFLNEEIKKKRLYWKLNDINYLVIRKLEMALTHTAKTSGKQKDVSTKTKICMKRHNR